MTKKGKEQFVCAGLSRNALHDKRVLDAIARVPREQFVPEDIREMAYDDRALPIGHGQTISQPFIVALMSQEARISKGDRVLEIGTGSGFQAAVLSELGAEVYSIEIVPELAEEAGERLLDLGYSGVHTRSGDGSDGWPEEAPFDAILVTAAAPRAPKALLEQLAEGGRLIIPLETGEDGEELTLFERRGEDFVLSKLGGVKFVPLMGSERGE